jgi:hypothetical protein
VTILAGDYVGDRKNFVATVEGSACPIRYAGCPQWLPLPRAIRRVSFLSLAALALLD